MRVDTGSQNQAKSLLVLGSNSCSRKRRIRKTSKERKAFALRPAGCGHRHVFRQIKFWAAILLMATGSAGAQANEATDAWVRVLHGYVDDRGRVDFARLAGNPDELTSYVGYIATVSPRSTPDVFASADAELAYYLNSYNALSMYNVIGSGIPGSLANLFRRFIFFYWNKFRVGGEKISLYAYENDVIRRLGDERVHFALNCMSISCPRLPRLPFTVGAVQSQLDAETRRFFSAARNIRVDHSRQTVEVSEILDFYTEDFLAKHPSLIAYINRYREEQIPVSYAVEFIAYDWTINSQ